MNDVTLGFELTTLEAAKAQTRANYQETAAKLNASLVETYKNAFNAAVAGLVTPPSSYSGLPLVPQSYVVADAIPPEGGGGAWPTIVQVGPPVCDALPLPADQTQHYSATARIGQHIGGPYWQAVDKLPDNEVPFPGKADDGTTGFWMRRTRFGNLGYYEKVA